MKKIQPVSIWQNGQTKSATLLNLLSNDNLKDGAVFAYSLLVETTDQDGVDITEQVADGHIGLGGQEYLDWSGTNDDAYSIIAGKLGLTLV